MVHAQTGALRAGQQAEGPGVGTNQQTVADQVTALYRAHGMDLVRIAAVMLGSRAGAEDAVQDAFYGLYRRWHQLADRNNALSYVRSAVINQCRSELRRQARLQSRADQNHRPLDAESPEHRSRFGTSADMRPIRLPDGQISARRIRSRT